MRTPRLLARSVAVAAILTTVLASCGNSPVETADNTTAAVGSTIAGGATTTIAATTLPASTVPASTVPKPTVSIPKTLPTTLVSTDLTKGAGRPAQNGDLVVVNYIGVRSADGTEFDNSYDKGQPFDITLGEGKVIKGWDQGLVGIQAGGRRQLDIPADLAYGDTAPTGQTVIKAGDALSFIVDALAVIPATNPADEPVTPVAGGPAVADVSFQDLVVGGGAEATDGQTVYLQLVAYRADTGAKINSTWASGNPQQATLTSAGLLPGIYEGMKGMKVGGRREITIPFMKAFGAAGNSNVGLPASTDLVVVIDLFAAL